MSLLSRLFGGGQGKPAPEPERETYKDFTITPTPIREGTSWRVSARIDKTVGGTARSHVLIRADTLESEAAAAQTSLAKARQMIDEQGDRLFD